MFAQNVCIKLGKSGCYFLDVVFLAEQICDKEIDALRAYGKAVKEGWCDEACYMKQPEKLLSYLTGKKVRCRHDVVGCALKKNEYEVTRYELRSTGVLYSHFVVTRNGRLVYDPYGESRTRTKGTAVSTRIFTVE